MRPATDLTRATLAFAALALPAGAAHAACVIEDVRPTGVLPDDASGQDFSFVARDGCVQLRFTVLGSSVTRVPVEGPLVGGNRHRYTVSLSPAVWRSLTGPGVTTFEWRVSGETHAGDATSVTTHNELDLDHDGWTRIDGDAGSCDLEGAIHPGMDEDCDNGVDDDCDGLVDNCGFGDPVATLSTDLRNLALGLFPRNLAVDDLDGDGIQDLALATTAGAGSRGAVYVAHGPLHGEIDVTDLPALLGSPAANIGGGVSTGDHDLDGIADVLAGAYPETDAYLFHGPVTADRHLADADAHLVGPAHPFSGSVSVRVELAGDFDGDGAPDAVVGTPYGAEYGAVFVVAGPTSGTITLETDAVYTFAGHEDGEIHGTTTTLGDLTGDGIDDLATHRTGLFGPPAAIYLLEGGLPAGTYEPSTVAWATLVAGPSGLYFGEEGVFLADYDGDGTDDFLVGDSLADGGASNSGVVYAFLGPFSGEVNGTDAATRWVGEESFGSLGEAVAAEDVDHDGEPDVLMGAPHGEAYRGAVYVQRGFATGSVDVATLPAVVGVFTSDWESAELGFAIAPIADWTGDGEAEIAIGAPSWDREGAVFVFGSEQMF